MDLPGCDEVEKAHPDVLEVFYQVFDKGYMEDGEGEKIDFKNTIILLTSNVGGEQLMEAAGGGETDPEVLDRRIRPVLDRHFHAAFLGRLITVPYLPLEKARSIKKPILERKSLLDLCAFSCPTPKL